MKKNIILLASALSTVAAFGVPQTPARGADGKTVELADGPAFGGRPLALGAEASGTTFAAKPGARPVVTAGRRVTGWTVGADGTWRARTDGFGRFAQLYVNGQLRHRPFLPRKGYWRIAAEVACAKGEPQKFVAGEGQVDAAWTDLGTIEVCTIQHWTMDRARITAYDAATRTVTIDLKGGNGNRPYGPRQWFRLDNVRAAFGEPGDWYLERDGTLLYRPLPGETPDAAVVTVPVGDCALALDGAHDVTFRGITFAFAGQTVPAGGCSSAQAAVKATAAVRVTRSRNVRFEDCAFVNVGGYALEFGPGAEDCAVTGSVFSGLGAGGVRIGGTKGDDRSQWAARCTVDSCLVEHGGRFDPAGVGVLVLNGNGCRIVRNTIRDLYYSGISCGWTWDRKPSGAFGNLIEGNDISAIGQGVLTDMGGIYLLGEQRGTRVRRNVIRSVRSHNWNGIGLYLDQGCAFIAVEENYVDDCTDGAFFVQYNTASNVVARNVLCRGGSAQLWHASSFPERTHPTEFRDNVLWWDDPKVPIARHFFHPRFIASSGNVAGCAGLKALPETARGVTLRDLPPPSLPAWEYGCARVPRLAAGLPPVPQTFEAGLSETARRADWKPSVVWHGFNLLGMFRAPTVGLAPDPRVDGRFSEWEFRAIRDWGFNFVRLPIDYRILTTGDDWTNLDEAKMKLVDEAVAWGRKYGIHVQISLHRIPGYCILDQTEAFPLGTSPVAQEAASRMWAAFARRWKGVPNEALSFNPFNEPTRHTDGANYLPLVRKLIAAIRAEDPKRFVMVDGAACASRPVPELYGDPAVGQAFRGYTPHVVTHYGADWLPQPKGGVSWPPKPEKGLPAWTLEMPAETVAKFAPALEAGEYCMVGEFGCRNGTPHAVTLAWMEHCLKLWREKNVGWALWNLRGHNGILDSGRADVDYEDFQGHKLDRRMLDLLRRYAARDSLRSTATPR